MVAVMIGVDPHEASHTAVAIGAAGELAGQLRVRASAAAQAEQLLAWARAWPQRAWAVEGTDGVGHLLARQLLAAGERVLDVQPRLSARVRLLAAGDTNKNDPNDARSVAVAALRSAGVREARADDHAAVLVPGGVSERITAGQAARIPGSITPAGPLRQRAASSPRPSSVTFAASTLSCAIPERSSPRRSGRPGRA